MKDKENKENNISTEKKGNWYLFINLVLILILLLGLKTNTAAWEAKFEVRYLIIFILIANTFLLFKDFILVSYSSEKKGAGKKHKSLKSLKPVRTLIVSTP